MSIFGKIKDAIFGHKAAPSAPPAGTTPSGQAPAGTATTTAQPPPQPQAQPVDVEAVLAEIARGKGNPDLNYKTSIVDLMKLLDLDSSLDNRKELATELGYTGPKDGSAEMNMWLHRKVMEELAKNQGQVPVGMKD